jgi:hypothetical protein
MDDLYAPEGGGSATAWQRKHNARKNREAAIKNRHALRAAEKDDLKKRLKKWRALTKKAKAEGWVPLARRRWRNGEGKVVSLGRPRILKKPIWIDMTGWRFGRLTVMRICPTSQNHRAQRSPLLSLPLSPLPLSSLPPPLPLPSSSSPLLSLSPPLPLPSSPSPLPSLSPPKKSPQLS